MNLSGNTILITGAGGGLGRALAREFLDRGNVVIGCDFDPKLLEESKKLLPALEAFVCDLSDAGERTRLFEKVQKEFPKVNVLVNNAAICQRMDLRQPIEPRSFEKEIATNFLAPLELMRLFMPSFIHRQGAVFINVLSRAGFKVEPSVPVYAGTKAGYRAFCAALDWQLRNEPIELISVFPPTIATQMNAQWPHVKKVSAEFVAAEAMKQLAKKKTQLWIGEPGMLAFKIRLVRTIFSWRRPGKIGL